MEHEFGTCIYGSPTYKLMSPSLQELILYIAQYSQTSVARTPLGP